MEDAAQEQVAAEPTSHVCGQCNIAFDSEQGYLDHTCAATGFTPTDPQHLGEDFALVQEEALARGEARKDEEIHPSEQLPQQ